MDKADKVANRYVDEHKQHIAKISYIEGYNDAIEKASSWWHEKMFFEGYDSNQRSKVIDEFEKYMMNDEKES